MNELFFLQDLAIVMAVSAAVMILCQRLHLPVVLGYIIAGIAIGPNTPPYALVKDLHSIHTLSELGVIFLLFSIGLEFNLTRLMRVGFVSFFAATLEIFLMIWIGFSLGRAFGWNFMNSLFLGAILSISSTTIIAKVLMEMKKVKEKFAQVILGILVIEDLLAILIIALLSGVASTGTLEWKDAGIAMIKVLAFIGGLLFFGFLLVPRLLKHVARFENAEMMVVTVLGLCLGVSLLAAKCGFSVALGAFLIGAVIAETRQVEDIIRKIDPIRDMFTAIFFVSVGMLLDPHTILQFWKPILIITLVTIAGKIFTCSLGTFLTGYPSETALKVGLGLAQIGEFSFIIARLGESARVTSPFLYPIAVLVSGITTVTTPFLMKNTGPIIRFLHRVTPKPLETVLSLYTGWFERDSRKIFYYALRFFISLGLGWIFFAVGSHFIPRLPLLAGTGVIIFVSGIFLWNSMRKIHERIEKIVLGIFDQEKPEQGQSMRQEVHQDLVKLIRKEYPWDVATEDFLLPYRESAVNQTIRDLRLRSETGATIAAIYREEGAIPNPPPETQLAPGDVLLLIGDQEQMKAAIQFLNRKIREPVLPAKIREGTPKTESFQIPEGSWLIGKTLSEIRLRRKTGATALGVQKGEISVPNPDPETLLEKGDKLILFGWPEQLEASLKYLTAP